MSGASIRITQASFEADLGAAVWPGLGRICCPGVESAAHLRRIDEVVSRLERLRGIRPGTVALQPFIETAGGVANAYDIASASPRVQAFGPGPKLYLHLDTDSQPERDALRYARSECELVARALGLAPAATEYLAD